MQDVGVVAGHVEGDDLVAGPQLHAPHPGGVAAHGPHVVSRRSGWSCPLRETMKTSSSPLVASTPTSSSPSRRLMAMNPSRRDLSYSEKAVFLTCPDLVAKSR